MICVCISTDIGDIYAELYDEDAPKTVEHFMRYVDEGYYSGSCFFRSARSKDNQPSDDIKIDVVEAGFYNDYLEKSLRVDIMEGKPFDNDAAPKPPYPPITVETTKETGILHVDGTISLGRDTVDTVADGFFICIGPQPSLDFGGMRHSDGFGFPAFGQIIKGMDLIRQIHSMETDGQKLKTDVKILSISRVLPF